MHEAFRIRILKRSLEDKNSRQNEPVLLPNYTHLQRAENFMSSSWNYFYKEAFLRGSCVEFHKDSYLSKSIFFDIGSHALYEKKELVSANMSNIKLWFQVQTIPVKPQWTVFIVSTGRQVFTAVSHPGRLPTTEIYSSDLI